VPAAQAEDERDSDEVSLEYSSENEGSENADPDEDDEPWLDMRRTSRLQDVSPGSLAPTVPGVPPAALGSPTAAVTAIKDQFAAQIQQIQQAMALHLQNLPQFPYLPQMPNMPPLAEYQAYLTSAAVFQRLNSMVPNIGGTPRIGSDGPVAPPSKELNGRWWDISSLMPSSAPPPAYEEIFPQTDFDKKQASAAQAAAEAEADHKCASLYDQPAVTTSTSDRFQKLPALLQIGRKNAITKEQQENLRRAHAAKLKRISRDKNLFIFWVCFHIFILIYYSRKTNPAGVS
jgi:hypothetical protein